MDEADIANDRMMQDLEIRLAEQRAKVKPYGPELCRDCGEQMLELRRQLGLQVCVECARLIERNGKLFWRD